MEYWNLVVDSTNFANLKIRSLLKSTWNDTNPMNNLKKIKFYIWNWHFLLGVGIPLSEYLSFSKKEIFSLLIICKSRILVTR